MAIRSGEAVDFICDLPQSAVKKMLILLHDTWVDVSIMRADPRALTLDQLFFYQVAQDAFSVLEAERAHAIEFTPLLPADACVNERESLQLLRTMDNPAQSTLSQFYDKLVVKVLVENQRPLAPLDLVYAFQLLSTTVLRRLQLEGGG